MKKHLLFNTQLNLASCVMALALILTAPFTSVQAAEKHWSETCASNLWTQNCWSATQGGAPDGLGQPLAGDNVSLFNTSANNYTVTYANGISPAPQLGNLTVDATGTGSMSLLLDINASGETLTTFDTTIGSTGTGVVNQTHGTHTVTNLLSLGNGQNSSGSYTINGSAAAMSVGGAMFVGLNGSGTFDILNGASVTNLGLVGTEVGFISSSMGTITVDGAGSALTMTNSLNIASGCSVAGLSVWWGYPGARSMNGLIITVWNNPYAGRGVYTFE